ncbi:SpoIIE family protein phosphatase [Streptomyces sp. NPDC005480]|uniref:SpoIIE family protein phosphatase n=1 Tax=Streptomyces sp. NPDC005480 TaxID=3154880 RepID=UPI0033B8CB37
MCATGKSLLLGFPPAGDSVRIVDRGHPSLLMLTPHGAQRLHTTPALPLGLGELGPGSAEVTTHPLRSGEVILLYTDGVSEARNAGGKFYPLKAPLPEGSGFSTLQG